MSHRQTNAPHLKTRRKGQAVLSPMYLNYVRAGAIKSFRKVTYAGAQERPGAMDLNNVNPTMKPPRYRHHPFTAGRRV